MCIQSYHSIVQQPGGNQLVGLCFADDTSIACRTPNDCFDGVCIGRIVNNQADFVCSIRCRGASDCPPSHACGPKEFEIEGSPQIINVCVAVGGFCQGTGIEAADMCYSGTCVTDDQDNNRGFCTTFCGNDSSCPSGWNCLDVEGTGICAQ
jgi:hypothetical protein